ncbi:MAG: magnesium/cobalt transporter CorA [bacterium]
MIKSYFYNAETQQLSLGVDLREKEILLDNPGNLLWIDLYDCTFKELYSIADIFEFHPLAVEDCLQDSPRAKVDKYDDYYFFVFHAPRYNEESDEEITTDELNIFLGTNYLITIHKDSLPSVARIAKFCNQQKTHMMERAPDYLLYNLVDGIVDEYFPIIERLSERIDELEDEIYVNPAKEITEEMLSLKRTILLLRKLILPQKRIFSNVNCRYSFTVKEENHPYYLDLVDHLERLSDSTDTYRDLVNNAMDTYYSIISNKTNEVMRVLTIISTIMMPLTFITGIFGMNVPIPFQDSRYEVWFILCAMAVLSILMIRFFHRRKWI